MLQPAPSLIRTSLRHYRHMFLHTATATRQRPHGGQSFRVTLYAWAHMQHALTAQPIKDNYLKIVTIRSSYHDPINAFKFHYSPYIHVLYPSSNDRSTVRAFLRNGVLAPSSVLFHLSAVPFLFRFHSVLLARRVRDIGERFFRIRG